MQILQRTEENEIATVFIAKTANGKYVEFVESTQPPMDRSQKWVLIISTLFGCPVDCKFCDAGGKYKGRLSVDELMFQIDAMVKYRFPEGNIDTDKFKIQFARMGEPAFNMAVLDTLEILPTVYDLPLFIPSVSSIAPAGTDAFFERLLEIKKHLYSDTFQLQFSVHTTDPQQRQSLMPVKKWSFDQMAAYGQRFYDPTGKKITLNFALAKENILDIDVLKKHFDPQIFLVKLTPVNPTIKAQLNKLDSLITEKNLHLSLQNELRSAGFETILSIGEWEENKIGSNCGQYLSTFLQSCDKVEGSYEYGVNAV